jgi:serine/threonine protein kinase
MLSGQRLYHFKTDIDALRTIPEKEIVPIINLRPEIPDELNRIVMKCLEKDPKQRYRNAAEIHQDLTRLKTKLRITYDASDLAAFMKKYFKKKENI